MGKPKTAVEYRYNAKEKSKERQKKHAENMKKKGFIKKQIWLHKEIIDELDALKTEKNLGYSDTIKLIFNVYKANKDSVISNTNEITDNVIPNTDNYNYINELKHMVLKLAEDMAVLQGNMDILLADPIEDVPKPVENQAEMLYENDDQTKEQTVYSRPSRPVKEVQLLIPAPVPKQNIELPDYLVDVKSDMPIEERHKIILQLAEDFPGRKNAQLRIDILNAAEIHLGGKPWSKTKQFADQLSIARRWIKKQETK